MHFYHFINKRFRLLDPLTLRGWLYRRRYQLVFFKTSAKDIKNTPSILVVHTNYHEITLATFPSLVRMRLFIYSDRKEQTKSMFLVMIW